MPVEEKWASKLGVNEALLERFHRRKSFLETRRRVDHLIWIVESDTKNTRWRRSKNQVVG